MTPVLLIGGMTTGLFTPTEGAIAASVWALVLGLVWYRTLSWKMFVKVSLDTVETTATVMFIVAAASIFGWMLTATGVTARDRRMGAGLHQRGLGVPAAGQPADAVRRLFPRADRGDHDPGAAAAADRAQARRRPGALRPGDGAEPDDRPAAPADGHGAVRAGAGGQAERRAHDDGDPAVAVSAAGQPGDPDLRAGDRRCGCRGRLAYDPAPKCLRACVRTRHAAGAAALAGAHALRLSNVQ